MSNTEWDVFISHASEDKESIARPLAVSLKNSGIKVWFDEFTLTIGDSLNRSINHGLSNSKFGIVILSESFFSKKWTQDELSGLVSKENGKDKVILPILHELSIHHVSKYSPILADRIALKSDSGVEFLTNKIYEVIKESSFGERKEELNQILELSKKVKEFERKKKLVEELEPSWRYCPYCGSMPHAVSRYDEPIGEKDGEEVYRESLNVRYECGTEIDNGAIWFSCEGNNTFADILREIRESKEKS